MIYLPSLGDLDPVKKAANRYSELFALAELTPAADAHCVTANEIDEVVALHGHPIDLLRKWMDDSQRLQQGANEFIPQMRSWLDGKHLEVKVKLRLRTMHKKKT
ncbi:hypothetical protein FB563_8465 [Streptomyces puniciscabiei]|uniref:Uncharacterized protein n=1 Tax=Streptomyces puniciscabiei TaxID=164348 RepID=A0A542SWX1_9ACTN|nr:hypothetical protein [Streptomyces puniciscabiei]TQK79093.1 hypothetical protein FB563_8465 [Streptomyces puniciscabiei]